MLQLRMKNHTGALESIDKVLSLEKDNGLISKVLAKKTNVLFQLHRYDESIAAAEKAVQLDPNNIGAIFYRGLSKSSKYQDGSGISDMTICINKKHKLLQAYYIRGFGYHREKNYSAAINDYTKAIELNPKYTRIYLNRGMCYKVLGNLEAARGDFNKVIEIALSTPDAERSKKELASL